MTWIQDEIDTAQYMIEYNCINTSCHYCGCNDLTGSRCIKQILYPTYEIMEMEFQYGIKHINDIHHAIYFYVFSILNYNCTEVGSCDGCNYNVKGICVREQLKTKI